MGFGVRGRVVIRYIGDKVHFMTLISNIKYYSNNCPKCKILQEKLNRNKIQYDHITDINLMIDMGMTTMPMLEVDGIMMIFSEAIKWVNSIEQM